VKLNITAKQKKMVVDYALAVAAAAVTMGVSLLMDLKPEYAVIIGAVTAPAIKWASKHSKDYGRGTE